MDCKKVWKLSSQQNCEFENSWQREEGRLPKLFWNILKQTNETWMLSKQTQTKTFYMDILDCEDSELLIATDITLRTLWQREGGRLPKLFCNTFKQSNGMYSFHTRLEERPILHQHSGLWENSEILIAREIKLRTWWQSIFCRGAVSFLHHGGARKIILGNHGKQRLSRLQRTWNILAKLRAAILCVFTVLTVPTNPAGLGIAKARDSERNSVWRNRPGDPFVRWLASYHVQFLQANWSKSYSGFRKSCPCNRCTTGLGWIVAPCDWCTMWSADIYVTGSFCSSNNFLEEKAMQLSLTKLGW